MKSKDIGIGTTFEIYTITDNKEYKSIFSSIEGITLAIQLPHLEGKIGCKAIYIDGRILPVKNLKDVRVLYPDIPVFYQSSNIQSQYLMQNVITTCLAHDIHHIHEDLTIEQVIYEVEQQLFRKGMKNVRRVVSMMGTHSGAGVSTTILNVADILAKRIEGKVIVLSLNPWDPSDYFLEYTGRYLNEIKIDLTTKNLSDEKFLDALHHYKDSFYHLAGNRDIKQQRYYSIEEIEYLIERARDLFDVVLIDAGPHFDNACYAQAYIGSDLRFLITTQEPKGYEGYFPHIFEQLLVPLGSKSTDFFLVINQLNLNNTLATEKDIVEVLKMTHLTSIPDEGVLGSSAITQKILLHENGPSREYIEMLLPIVRAIIGQYNLKQKDIGEVVKKGMFNMFKKKKVI
jgi:MinD-like ATPase involved in chromosome partitioning or flagellar assembly